MNIVCSFCGRKESVEQATQRFIAGPRNVFICRPCVELCAETFSTSDPAWRDALVDKLRDTARGKSR